MAVNKERQHTQPLEYFMADKPEWMTEEAVITLMRGYLLSNETPNQMYERIAKAAASYVPNGIGFASKKRLEADFLYAFLKGWLSPATPVAANLGSGTKNQATSCFGISVGNSIKQIGESITEAMLLTKAGGGLGINLSNIKGMTSPTQWSKFFDLVGSVVSQSGVRRGSVAIYVDINDPGIEEFLNSKDLLQGDVREKLDCNIAVIIDDSFMEKLFQGDLYVKRIFCKVLELRMKFGSPYIQFIGNCHRQDPEFYTKLGMKTGSSQLCLTGDTLVTTKEGIEPIKDLVGRKVTINDGENWVENESFFYKGKERVLEITLGSGQKIKMTEEHRCPIQTNRNQIKTGSFILKKAKELVVGEKLFESPLKNKSHGELKLSSAYLKGFLLGDGTSYKIRGEGNFRPKLVVYKPKYPCIEELLKSSKEVGINECYFGEERNYLSEKHLGDNTHRTMMGFRDNTELVKFTREYRKELPLWFCKLNVQDKAKLISGLYDADGCVSNGVFQLSSIHKEFINSISVLLCSFGFAPNIDVCKRNSKSLGNNDIYRISLKRKDSLELFSYGYMKRLSLNVNQDRDHYKRSSEWRKIVNIITLEEQDVYCTHVPSTSFFTLWNGILTGNCSEIIQFHDSEHTYSCQLSSLNAAKYDEWRNFVFKSGFTLPGLATIFLDCVNEDFIQRASKIPGLENAVRSARKGRALGLGVLGLHSYYLSKMIPWNSVTAKIHNKSIFKFVNDESLKASKVMAESLGEPEWLKGEGIRNIVRIAVAPTTTNSLLCNAGSPGIEPVFSMYYSVASAKGSFVRKNKYLEELLEEKGKNNGHVWASIRDNQGSVQHLPFLTEYEKRVFLTAFEIDQMSIIDQASDRQKYIDQGQSLNLFFNSDSDSQTIMDVHIAAYKKDLKTLYYLRSDSMLQNESKGEGLNFAYIKTRPDCPYCTLAKELFQSKGIEYIEELKPEGRVPEIWIEGEKLDDGYSSLKKKFFESDLTQQEESSCVSCEG